MANIKIIDLPTGSPESTSFVEATQVDALAESGRSTVKLALNALGNFVAGQGASPLEYGDLKTELTTLIGGINELHDSIGADAYDDTATYNTGDYCIHNGGLYKCNDDNVTGAWNAAKWDATILIDELGTGGGASVTLGTTVPIDASGENGDLYVQYDSSTYAVVEYFVKVNDSWRKAPYSRVVSLTQAQYDLITPDPTTLYIITDAQSSYQTKNDNSLDTDDKTVSGAINELHDSIGADVFDPNVSYTVGMYCINNNTLYRCKSPTSGAWDSSKWDSTTITSLIESKANASDVPVASEMFGFTAQTGVTNLNGGSVKMGNGRFINHNINITSAFSANQKLIQLANSTDFPSGNKYLVLIGGGNLYKLTLSNTGGIFTTGSIPIGEYIINGNYSA